MDDTVRIQPKTTYASLSAALTLSHGRRIALVFPLGERTCLHNTDALAAFYKRCQLLGKQAVIIGGDAWLRARAVATGFETATSLEDWGETAPELYAPHPERFPTGTPRLWLVAPPTTQSRDMANGEDEDEDEDEDASWTSEPPNYVIELRRAFPQRSPVVQAPIMSNALPSAVPDEDIYVDAVTASERFEELITGRILETSGIHRSVVPGAP